MSHRVRLLEVVKVQSLGPNSAKEYPGWGLGTGAEILVEMLRCSISLLLHQQNLFLILGEMAFVFSPKLFIGNSSPGTTFVYIFMIPFTG